MLCNIPNTHEQAVRLRGTFTALRQESLSLITAMPLSTAHKSVPNVHIEETMSLDGTRRAAMFIDLRARGAQK